jgi:hypothetical protein
MLRLDFVRSSERYKKKDCAETIGMGLSSNRSCTKHFNMLLQQLGVQGTPIFYSNLNIDTTSQETPRRTRHQQSLCFSTNEISHEAHAVLEVSFLSRLFIDYLSIKTGRVSGEL